MGKHLIIGGSTAARTIACPAWIGRSKNMPKQKSNVYADEGNLLHDAMEEYYQNGVTFDELIGKLTYEEQVLNAEHVKHLLEPTRDCVEKVFDKYDIDEFICEPFVEIVKGEQGGSIDLLGVSTDRKTVLVLDYKFGKNGVEVEDNKQLQFYGLAAKTDKKTADFFDEAERVVYCIIQPKLSYIPQLWENTVEALEDFRADLNDALDNPERSATGKHCKYCPAEAVCPDKNEPKRQQYENLLQKIVDKK